MTTLICPRCHRFNVLGQLAVPVGQIRLVLYDDRADSPTQGHVEEILLSPKDYNLVTIPPLIWNGFQAVGPEMALIANCASMEHDPAEIRRLDPSDSTIPYRWKPARA